MLRLSEKYINVDHIYKGELVISHAKNEDFTWDTIAGMSTSIGSLLLDFNNFRKDKTVFLLHTAEYIEEPSLLTLARMAKYCEMESRLALTYLEQILHLDPDKNKFMVCLKRIRQASKAALDWSYTNLLKLTRRLRHLAALTANSHDSEESNEDVVLKILTQWSSQEYRAVLGKHEHELDKLSSQLYQEIFEHMYAIYFRIKVCNLHFIIRECPLSQILGPYGQRSTVIPRVANLARVRASAPYFDEWGKELNQAHPKYFTPNQFMKLLLCGNISNFTKTSSIHPLHRSYRVECDKIGDHHQLLRISDNARIVAHNIRLVNNCTLIEDARLTTLVYNREQMKRITRLHKKQTNIFMGLSVRPALVWHRNCDGSYGQKVFVEYRPTWFYPAPFYVPDQITPPLFSDKLFWTDPLWGTIHHFTRKCIEDDDSNEELYIEQQLHNKPT